MTQRKRVLNHACLWLVPAIFLFGILVPRPALACSCDCYYNDDCSGLSWCGDYGSCTRVGKKDGTCSFWNFPGVDRPTYAAVLDLWLQAYEVAGAGGGGPPDPALVAQAQAASASLPPQNAQDIRELAFFIEAAYLGLANDGGAFAPPTRPENCSAQYPPGENGVVDSIDPCTLAVAQTIREAFVAELLSPGEGNFQAIMAEIPAACPTYATPGRCEYPHPPSHGHPFPYPDGLSCLTGELFGPLQGLSPGVTAIPSLSAVGLIILASLFGLLGLYAFRR